MLAGDVHRVAKVIEGGMLGGYGALGGGDKAESHGFAGCAVGLGAVTGEAREGHVGIAHAVACAAEVFRYDVVEGELVGLVVAAEHKNTVAVETAVGGHGRGPQRSAACP